MWIIKIQRSRWAWTRSICPNGRPASRQRQRLWEHGSIAGSSTPLSVAAVGRHARVAGGRSWWTHSEFTRMNTERIILHKQFEDLRVLVALGARFGAFGRWKSPKGSRYRAATRHPFESARPTRVDEVFYGNKGVRTASTALGERSPRGRRHNQNPIVPSTTNGIKRMGRMRSDSGK